MQYKPTAISAIPKQEVDKFEPSFGLGQRKQIKLLQKIAQQNEDFTKSQKYWANYGIESTYRLGCEIEKNARFYPKYQQKIHKIRDETLQLHLSSL